MSIFRVECGFVNIPLYNIYLSSDLVNGPVAVGNRQTLPFKGVHLLLNNDVIGDKVVVNALVTDTRLYRSITGSYRAGTP